MLWILLNCQDYFDSDLPNVMTEEGRKTFWPVLNYFNKPYVSLCVNYRYMDVY